LNTMIIIALNNIEVVGKGIYKTVKYLYIINPRWTQPTWSYFPKRFGRHLPTVFFYRSTFLSGFFIYFASELTLSQIIFLCAQRQSVAYLQADLGIIRPFAHHPRPTHKQQTTQIYCKGRTHVSQTFGFEFTFYN